MASIQSNTDWQLTKRSVLERNRHMFNNSTMSDINFSFEGSDEKLYAHKYVLATSSSVFYAMFYGALAERGETVKLNDTDATSFEEFLRFLYTDECDLTLDNAGSVLYLAKKYMVQCLSELCVDVLEKEINSENVLSILEKAMYFGEKELETTCWHVVERYTTEIVSSESFSNISRKMLMTVLNRRKLVIREVELFKAVLKWSEVQCSQKNLMSTAENRRSVIGDAIYLIKFLSMSQQEFAGHVSRSGLLTPEELVPMYEKFNGFQPETLKWSLSKREPPLKTVAVSDQKLWYFRFESYVTDASWQYDCFEPDRLCFSVSKDALFHGVRLFGSINSSYDVTLDVKGAKVTGKYRLGSNVAAIIGFNVMLESPIIIEANEVVTVTARIKGPPSFKGIDGKRTITHRGITVTFSDAHFPNHGTTAAQGQFRGILLSV